MSDNIIIKNEQQLLEFLKVLSEESYKSSINEFNSDPFTTKYETQYSKDEKLYGSLDEQEEIPGEESVEAPGEEAGAEEAGDDAGDDDQADEVEAPEAKKDVTINDVIIAINNLRSGQSLKNKEVKGDVDTYFERLSQEEKIVLYTFLDSLADILTGEVEGQNAQDPSDQPVGIVMKTSDEEADQEADEDVEELAPDEEPPEVPGETEEEDTTPPIAVSESQRKDMLREKVRILMSR